MRIAILEDDSDQADLIKLWLERAEHSVSVFSHGKQFLRGSRRESFDLFVLDWMLPDVNGIEVLAELRGELQDTTPVIVTTVKNHERDIIKALDRGADDYLAKPVREGELVARVHAIARRMGIGNSAQQLPKSQPYEIDPANKHFLLNGEEIPLTQREFNLALFFFRNAGRPVSRSHILDAIWGIDNAAVSTRTIDTHISRLRKKIRLNKDNGWTLSSIYQYGYRLERTGS